MDGTYLENFNNVNQMSFLTPATIQQEVIKVI